MEAACSAETTRRELMCAVLAGGAIGAGAALSGAPGAIAQGQTDGELVGTLLGGEMLAVFVYAQAVHSGLLTPDSERLARHVLGHERAHARVLGVALSELGGTPPPRLRSVSDADKLLAASNIAISLTQLRTEPDFLRLLIHVEIVLERSYYVAVAKLQDTGLQRDAAQVLAAEAQHATALIELLFPGDVTKSVPESFVEGNPGDARV
jgi:hypothetical protein